MSDRQSIICDWICTAGFVKGGTLQVGRFVETSPERCIMVKENAGTQDMTQPRQDVMYQVVSRAISPADSRADSMKVYDFLYKNGNIELPSVTPEFFIEIIEPVTLPQPLMEDEKNRTLYSCNYKFVIFLKGGK